MIARPTLPPLLFVAAPCWVVCAGAFSLLRLADRYCMTGCVVLGCAGMLACIAVLFFDAQGIWFACLGVCLGLACAGQGAYALSVSMDRAQEALVQTYRVQITEDVHESDYGLYCQAVALGADGTRMRVRANLPQDATASCWYVFEYTGAIRKPADQAQRYYWQNGLVGSITLTRANARPPAGLLGAVCAVRAHAGRSYTGSGTGQAFMRSIVLGDRRDFLTSPEYGTIKRAGLAHIVAVSGAHLAVTVAAVGALLQCLRIYKGVVAVAQIAICVLFVLLTGAPHSALRACVMTVCALASWFSARRSFALNALALCIIVFLCLDPTLALSLSLLLSALATLGIVLFAGYGAEWVRVVLACPWQRLCDTLGMTLAAVLATLPVSAAAFGQVSLVAPLSNIVAAPLFALLCVGGMVAGVLPGWMPGASVLPALMVEAGEAFCSCVGLIARIPYAATVATLPGALGAAVAAALVVALLYFWPTPTRRVGLCAVFASGVVVVALLFCAPRLHGSEIVMLDVGQGDAFLLRSGNKALLVDTGTNDSDVLKGLAAHDVHHLDAVLVTHPDDDHCGSLPAVLDFIEVDHVLVAADLLDCAGGNCARLRASVGTSALAGVRKGETFSWGTMQATVLSPDRFVEEGGNADSVVLLVVADIDQDGVGDVSALFTGDAEEEVLARLQHEGRLPDVDIYKVGHHGSSGAVSPGQLETMSPALALVSVGAQNRYGHPAPDTLEVLSQSGIQVYRSDQSGDVVCKLSPDRIDVVTAR